MPAAGRRRSARRHDQRRHGDHVPLAHKIGLRVVEAGRGHAAVTVPAEGNGNHIGVIYAAQFTAAELLGGIIGLTTVDRAKYFPLVLVKNVDVKFVGMAWSEIRAQAALDEETIARVEAEAAQRARLTSRSKPW